MVNIKVTVHNFDENVVKQMIKTLIELIEYQENVKIEYEIKKVEK